MDKLTRQGQTDACLSAVLYVAPAASDVIDLVRQELTLLREVAEAADIYRATNDRPERREQLDAALDAWKGY